MNSSQPSGTQKVVNQTNPPAAVAPYIGPAAQAATNLYNTGGPKVNPASTVANLSPETQQGWAATAARAANGSPLNADASSYIHKSLAGDYLNPGNPYLGAVDQSEWDATRPRIDSLFSGAGRYGSNQHVAGMTTAYNDAIAPYHYQDYSTNRGLQQQAAQMAPGQAGQDYVDTAALTGVGTARDVYGQALTTDANNRFNAQQQRPYENLNWYSGQLYGNPYTSQTTRTPIYSPSTGQQVLGGVLGAAGAAGSIAGLF